MKKLTVQSYALRILGASVLFVIIGLLMLFLYGAFEKEPPHAKITGSSTTPAHISTDLATSSAKPRPSISPANSAVVPPVASFGWGAGTHELGKSNPQEGNPEAPMSFSRAPDGSTIVLDQVNGRLMRVKPDGSRVSSPLDLSYPQDVASTSSGGVVVLDRLTDKTIAVLDADGKVVGKLPLVPHVEEPEGITGVFVDGEDVFVEKEHGPLVKVGTTDGTPVKQPEQVPGRPSRNGAFWMLAGIVEAPTGRAFLTVLDRPSKKHRYTSTQQFLEPVLSLVLLDTDKQGTIYLAAQIGDPEAHDVRIRLLCIDPAQGAVVGSQTWSLTPSPEEVFREMSALDSGGVLFAERSATGMTFRTYQCDPLQ